MKMIKKSKEWFPNVRLKLTLCVYAFTIDFNTRKRRRRYFYSNFIEREFYMKKINIKKTDTICDVCKAIIKSKWCVNKKKEKGMRFF